MIMHLSAHEESAWKDGYIRKTVILNEADNLILVK